MDFRVDLAIVERLPKGCRFGLTLHNLSEKSHTNWQLHFVFERFITPDSLSQGNLTQVGTFCSLNIEGTPLYANNHVYVEFCIATAPLKSLNDGIQEAYLNTDSLTQYPVTTSPIVLGSGEDKSNPITDVFEGRHGLIPEPQSIELGDSVYELTRYSQICVEDQAMQSVANWLKDEIDRLFAITTKSIGQQDIRFRHSPVLDNEAYKLRVDHTGIEIESNGNAGFVYGCATLMQLMDFDKDRQTLYVPHVSIHDAPRFRYRGVMLDSARSFQPVSEIKRLLNLLAHYKINTFHWHLTDDEAWRLEIHAFPELTEVGAWRGAERALEPQLHSIQRDYGGYYTQQEVAEIIEYAAARNIQVIPEIDVPGHSRAAIKSLPHLLVDKEDSSSYRSAQNYCDNVLSPGLPGTYQFLDTVFEEVAALFPSPFIHIGADQVPVGVWSDSPSCHTLMAEHGYHNPKDLQGHLLRHVEDKLKSLGKRMLGWEEGNLVNKVSKDTIVYSWLSEEAAINSAKLGYDIILQPGQSTYLDMAQDNNTTELGVHSANAITLEKAYHYEPLAQLHPDDPVKKRILGMQAAVWTERITSPDTLDYMMFPRLTALAETAWSTSNHKDYRAFLSRLKRHLSLLDRQHVKYKHPWPIGQGIQGAQYQTQRQ